MHIVYFIWASRERRFVISTGSGFGARCSASSGSRRATRVMLKPHHRIADTHKHECESARARTQKYRLMTTQLTGLNNCDHKRCSANAHRERATRNVFFILVLCCMFAGLLEFACMKAIDGEGYPIKYAIFTSRYSELI